MKRYLVTCFLMASVSSVAAQQAQDASPAASGTSEANKKPEAASDAPCPADDALCILAQNLKKKDPGTGSNSGSPGGFIANEPPTVPGNRLDLEFLRKNEVKG